MSSGMLRALLDMRARFKSPLFLDIHINDKCNLKCIMCDTRTYYEENPGELVDPRILTQQLKILKRRGLIGVVVGGTEPLLHPNLCKILRKLQAIGLKPILITNGLLLKGGTSKALAKLGIEIVVSLDGATPEINDAIRGSGTFQRIVDGISRLVANRKKTPKTHVSINMCIMSINQHEVEDIIKLGEKLGVDEVLFQNVDTNNRGLKPDKRKLATALNKIDHNRETYDLRIPPTLYIRSLVDENTASMHCYVPWLISNVDAYGNVFGCWRIKQILGNIKETAFWDIWASKEYSTFRNQIKTRKPPVCKDCMLLCYTPFNLIFNNFLRHPVETVKLIRGFYSRS